MGREKIRREIDPRHLSNRGRPWHDRYRSGARLAVGLGEGPAFPAATQAMRNWYPPHRFGYIQGITHSASRLGAALAPPIVAALIVWMDWRISFVICGVAALIWSAAWWFFFQ